MKLLITTLTFMFISFGSYANDPKTDQGFTSKHCAIIEILTESSYRNIVLHKQKKRTDKEMVNMPYNEDSIKWLDYFYKEVDAYTKLFNTFCKEYVPRKTRF